MKTSSLPLGKRSIARSATSGPATAAAYERGPAVGATAGRASPKKSSAAVGAEPPPTKRKRGKRGMMTKCAASSEQSEVVREEPLAELRAPAKASPGGGGFGGDAMEKKNFRSGLYLRSILVISIFPKPSLYDGFGGSHASHRGEEGLAQRASVWVSILPSRDGSRPRPLARGSLTILTILMLEDGHAGESAPAVSLDRVCAPVLEVGHRIESRHPPLLKDRTDGVCVSTQRRVYVLTQDQFLPPTV